MKFEALQIFVGSMAGHVVAGRKNCPQIEDYSKFRRVVFTDMDILYLEEMSLRNRQFRMVTLNLQ